MTSPKIFNPVSKARQVHGEMVNAASAGDILGNGAVGIRFQTPCAAGSARSRCQSAPGQVRSPVGAA